MLRAKLLAPIPNTKTLSSFTKCLVIGSTAGVVGGFAVKKSLRYFDQLTSRPLVCGEPLPVLIVLGLSTWATIKLADYMWKPQMMPDKPTYTPQTRFEDMVHAVGKPVLIGLAAGLVVGFVMWEKNPLVWSYSILGTAVLTAFIVTILE